jgi:hypothetical protein
VIRADVSIDSKPAAVIEDGAGNWLVTFESFLPQEGTNIPRGVLAARVSNGGVVLDQGGRLIYNHHNQFMSDSDIARAGDRYLLTFVDVATSHGVMGLLLDASLNPLRNGPEQLSGRRREAARRLERRDVVRHQSCDRHARRPRRRPRQFHGLSQPRLQSPNRPSAGTASTGSSPFSTNYNAATQTYLNNDDLYVSRISATGALLDPSGLLVKGGAGHQVSPGIAPGINGGAQVAWQDIEKSDVGDRTRHARGRGGR